jgi:hypothetical protein
MRLSACYTQGSGEIFRHNIFYGRDPLVILCRKSRNIVHDISFMIYNHEHNILLFLSTFFWDNKKISRLLIT